MSRRASVGVVIGLVVAIFLPAGWSVSGGGGRALAGPKPNACGCFRDSVGACSCAKKAKCGCPGDCEPKGCDEKRSKQLEKEIAAETKKAAGAGNKHAVADTKGHRDDGAGESEGDDGAKGKAKAKGARMSAKQKKELGKLLDAYLAEHPDEGAHTIDQLRESVAR